MKIVKYVLIAMLTALGQQVSAQKTLALIDIGVLQSSYQNVKPLSFLVKNNGHTTKYLQFFLEQNDGHTWQEISDDIFRKKNVMYSMSVVVLKLTAGESKAVKWKPTQPDVRGHFRFKIAANDKPNSSRKYVYSSSFTLY